MISAADTPCSVFVVAALGVVEEVLWEDTHLLPMHNVATAATKSPRADAEGVPPCCYRVLAVASDGPLATAYFAEFHFYELR
jgi:hypothetical protein